jgi:hypothetical protein
MGYEHGWNTTEFIGLLLAICGAVFFLAILFDNDWGKVKWHAWERWEQCVFTVGIPAALLGMFLVVCGCGGGRSVPTAPVQVEVVHPASDFEPTMNFYLYLSLARMGFAECEAARVSPEEGGTIRAAARQEAQLLRDEFDAYVHSGQGGLYCGPVCEEMKSFLEDADVSICEE